MHNKNVIMPFGLEGLVQFLDEVSNIDTIFNNNKTYKNYPPTNIYEDVENNSFIIKFALAGWEADELEIFTTNNNELVVRGIKKNKVEDGLIPVYEGIAKRDFTKPFNLSNYIDNVESELEEGMLTVTVFHKDVIEDNRKTFEIKNKNNK